MDKRFLYGIGALVAGYAGIKMVNKESYSAENSGFNPVVLCKTCGYETTISDWPRGKNKYTCNCEIMGDIAVICKTCNKETTYNSYKYGYCGCSPSKNAESFAAEASKLNLTVKELLLLIAVNKDWNNNDWDMIEGKMYGNFWHDEWDMKKMRGVISSLVKKGVISAMEDSVNNINITLIIVNNKFTTGVDDCEGSINWNMFECKKIPSHMDMNGFVEWAGGLPNTMISGMMESSAYGAESFATENGHLSRCLSYKTCGGYADEGLSLCWPCQNLVADAKQSYSADTSKGNEILRQLGGRRFLMMVGGKNPIWDDKKSELSIKIGRNNLGANWFVVHLNPKDLYNLRFESRRMNRKTYDMSIKVKEQYNDVYADQLQDIFEKATGLYTHMAENETFNNPLKENTPMEAVNNGKSAENEDGERRFFEFKEDGEIEYLVFGKGRAANRKTHIMIFSKHNGNEPFSMYDKNMGTPKGGAVCGVTNRAGIHTFQWDETLTPDVVNCIRCSDYVQSLRDKNWLFTEEKKAETFEAEGKLLEANNSPYYLKTVTFEKGYAFKKNKSRGFEGGHPDGGLNSSEIFIREGIFTSREDAMADLDKTMEVIDNLIVSHPYKDYLWVSYDKKQSPRMKEGNEKYVWTNHTINGYRFEDTIGTWYVEYKQLNKLQ
tara:strand:+ start:1574 stop:3562 length:1989 start_codon:yes stop_codon:yes gene_type:complete